MPLGASLLCLLAAGTVSADLTDTATSAPRVDIISIGVGGSLYAIFGHTAIRVVEPGGRDRAFNFGGVDVRGPSFYAQLMSGRVEAFLNVTSYADLLLQYSGEDRTIIGRTLDLTTDEARRLVEELDAIDAEPSRRRYVYDHLFDNCATRVAEVLDHALQGRLRAESSYPVRGTYRSWLLDGIHHRPWTYLGLDLTGNGVADEPLTGWTSMFLPRGIDLVLDRARARGRPIVKHRYTDYRTLGFADREYWDWPWTKVYLLFVAPLLGLIVWRPRVGTALWGLAAGLSGFVFLALWVVTPYAFHDGNWNLVTFPPTHLLLALWALRRRWWERARTITRIYLAIHAAATVVLVLLSWSDAIAQSLGPMLGVALPLAVASSVRAWPRFASEAPKDL